MSTTDPIPVPQDPKEKPQRAKLHTPPASPLPPIPPPKVSPSVSPITGDCPSTTDAPAAITTSPSEADPTITTPITPGDLPGSTPTKPSPRKGRLQTHHYKTICTVRHTPPTTPLPPLPPHQSTATPASSSSSSSATAPSQSTPRRKTSSPTSSSSSSSLSSPQVQLAADPGDLAHTLSRTTSEVFGRAGGGGVNVSSSGSRGQRASQVVPRLRLSNTMTAADGGVGSARPEHCHIQAVNRSSSALDMVAMAAAKHPHSARLPVVDAPEFAATPRGGAGSGSAGGRSGGAHVLTHSASMIQGQSSQSAKGSELGTPRRFGSIKKFFTIHPSDKSSSANSSPRRGPLRAMLKNRVTGGGGGSGVAPVQAPSLAEGRSMPPSPRQQDQQEPPNMLTMMFSPDLKESFHCFLKAKFADENILFVDDCARFAESEFASQHALEAAAKRIYDTYVREGAPLELNIGYEQRRPLEEALSALRKRHEQQDQDEERREEEEEEQQQQPPPALADPAAVISQAVFEDLALDIRNFMEVAFLPAWVAAGAWRSIPYEPYAPNLPSLQQVLGSRRMLNQLLFYVAGHGGARLAEALVLCDGVVKEPSSVETFDEAVKACGDVLRQKVVAGKHPSSSVDTDVGNWNEDENEDGNGEPKTTSTETLSLTPEERVATVTRLKKKVCKVLESKYYLDWVVRKTWTCVYIQPHHHSHHEDNDSSSSHRKEEEEKEEEKENENEKCKEKEEEQSHQECCPEEEEEENHDGDRE